MAVVELWETVKHAIGTYTGLSPATFFTLLALAAAFYHVVSGFLAPTPAPRTREMEFEASEPLPPPVQLGEITEEELRAYDGADSKKPLLMAIKSQIYDVTQSRMFYGPGGPYALFAGKDASRALAKMSFEQKDLTGDISGLGPFELEALQDWEYKFMSKYVKVGTIKKTVPETDGSSENTSETTATASDTTKVDHVTEAAEPKEDGSAEHGGKSKAVHVAEAEPSAEPEENGSAEHGAESEDGPADHPAGAEVKEVCVEAEEDGSAGHSAGAEHGAESELKEVEVKEVGAGEGTKE